MGWHLNAQVCLITRIEVLVFVYMPRIKEQQHMNMNVRMICINPDWPEQLNWWHGQLKFEPYFVLCPRTMAYIGHYQPIHINRLSAPISPYRGRIQPLGTLKKRLSKSPKKRYICTRRIVLSSARFILSTNKKMCLFGTYGCQVRSCHSHGIWIATEKETTTSTSA